MLCNVNEIKLIPKDLSSIPLQKSSSTGLLTISTIINLSGTLHTLLKMHIN